MPAPNLRETFLKAVNAHFSTVLKIAGYLEADGNIKQATDSAGVRTFTEIVRDDAAKALADIASEVPEEQLPVAFFRSILNSAGGDEVSEDDAREKLLQAIRRPLPENWHPEFLTVMHDAETTTQNEGGKNALAQAWPRLLSNMVIAASTEAGLSLHLKADGHHHRYTTAYYRLSAQKEYESEDQSAPVQKTSEGAATGNNVEALVPAKQEQKQNPSLADSLLDCISEKVLDALEEGSHIPAIGREGEIARMLEILSQYHNGNPVLVGPPGVGKRTLVEDLAAKILDGEAPQDMETMLIYDLDYKKLKMDAVSRQSTPALLMEGICKELAGADNSILFIDNIEGDQDVLGAADTEAVQGVLGRYLSQRRIRCIGTTTKASNVTKSPFFRNNFTTLPVEEPDFATNLEIAHEHASLLAAVHDVEYCEEACKSAVNGAEKYMRDTAAPKNFISILDACGAELRRGLSGEDGVTAVMVERKMSEITGKKIDLVSDTSRIASLEERLKKEIFGQGEAIEKTVEVLKRAHVKGLRKKARPLGSFLYTGPSGVGKTELAKQVNDALGMEFKAFDMSEYMEKHEASKLIGSPPGYVGHDEGGHLTEWVSQHPNSLILMDEVEKAHPDIYNLLLQIMEEGRVTDNHGKTVDCSGIVLVMTSNLTGGAADLGDMGFGGEGGKEQRQKSAANAAIKGYFRPEFVGRLDARVDFKTLGGNDVHRIVDKFIGKTAEGLIEENGIELVVTQSARDHIASIGFDHRLGARPMKRAVEKHIENKIASGYIDGKITDNSRVEIDYDENKGITLKATEKVTALVRRDMYELPQLAAAANAPSRCLNM